MASARRDSNSSICIEMFNARAFSCVLTALASSSAAVESISLNSSPPRTVASNDIDTTSSPTSTASPSFTCTNSTVPDRVATRRWAPEAGVSHPSTVSFREYRAVARINAAARIIIMKSEVTDQLHNPPKRIGTPRRDALSSSDSRLNSGWFVSSFSIFERTLTGHKGLRMIRFSEAQRECTVWQLLTDADMASCRSAASTACAEVGPSLLPGDEDGGSTAWARPVCRVSSNLQPEA